MAEHTCDPSTWEEEAGSDPNTWEEEAGRAEVHTHPLAQDQPGLQEMRDLVSKDEVRTTRQIWVAFYKAVSSVCIQ